MQARWLAVGLREGVMTDAQKKLASYILGSAGNCYHMSDHTKRCVVGMLETGEVAEEDFKAIKNGQTWLDLIRQYAADNGWKYWE